MKTPTAKAVVDKEWDKSRNVPAWDQSDDKSKQKVLPGPEPKSVKVRFAALMDLCRLKHPELEHLQTYRERVVLRIHNVKDDTGECAVFTEQGAPAFQMTAAKVLDTISPLPSMHGRRGD